jgi:hypothetical protein
MVPSTMKTAPERSGDPVFGVVTGFYLALLVTPPVVFAVGEFVTADAAGRYVTAVVTGVVVLGLGWLTTERMDGLAPSIGATRLRWALAALPVGYALAGFGSLEQTGSVGVVAFFFGIGAMAVGFVLGVMARTRHADAVLDGVERECEFRAGWPDAARRRRTPPAPSPSWRRPTFSSGYSPTGSGSSRSGRYWCRWASSPTPPPNRGRSPSARPGSNNGRPSPDS